ncbi:AfsR/SARP family transcriptional regulator [Deinococcus cavernae]|uniref:AfsR/SARP family transcriptional regulator n=1 Tax=Deinococcus cavernae TaxID=2320857 RepID=UPI001F1F9762|nr:bacterial transcriptional activator domain-containing protein [Deinococcus cavernae]
MTGTVTQDVVMSGAGRYILRSLGQADVLLDGRSVCGPPAAPRNCCGSCTLSRRAVTGTIFCSQLWGLEDNTAAANRFRVALHRLRAALEWPDAVTEQGGRYRLHPELLEASDTYRLHQALRASRQSETLREREELLRQALASADGEYLPHLQGEWVEQARAQHRAAVVEGYLTLSELHCAARECPLAAQALVKAAQSDPLIGEDHHQRLMACLSMTRDRFAAIEHYRRYRHFLASEVGDTPMHDTELLAERIKAGERVCEHLPFTPQKT